MNDTAILQFLVGVLVQSTVLIGGGLLAAWICGPRRAAVQSAILRATLATVMLCPLASFALGSLGVDGVRLVFVGDSAVRGLAEGRGADVALTGLQPDRLAAGPAAEASLIDDVVVATEASPALAAEAPASSSAQSSAQTAATVPAAGGSARPEPRAAGFSAPAFHFASWLGAVVSVIWLAGAGVLLARLLVANLLVLRLRRDSRPAEAGVAELCQQASAGLGLRCPEVRQSSAVGSPLLLGVLRPVILLPADAGVPRPGLRSVLLHELAHLARRDCLVHLLAQAATCVLFFQPLLWRLARRLEEVAEDVCDDYVVQYGADRKGYARTLVDYADGARPHWAAAAALGVVSLRSSLSRRVVRILDTSRTPSVRLGPARLVVVALLGISATAVTALIGAQAAVVADDQTAAHSEDASPQAPVSDSQDSDESSKKDQPAAEKADSALTFQGRVVDPKQQPVKGAKVFLNSWRRSDSPLLATTDEQGKFRFDIPPSNELHGLVAEAGGLLVAAADGFGPAANSAHQCETTGRLARLYHQQNSNLGVPPAVLEFAIKRSAARPTTFQLVADDVPLKGRVVDIEGRPVAGAKIRVSKVTDGGRDGLQAWEKAARKPHADYYSLQRLLGRSLGNDVGGTVLNFIAAATTDQEGSFVLKGVGRQRIANLLISGPGIETAEVYARTAAGEPVEIVKEPRNPGLGTLLYHAAEFTHVAGPSEAVTGTVVDAASKQPLAGVTVQSYRLAGRRMSGWTEGIVRAETDEHGRYRLEGLPIGENEVLALSPIDQPYLLARHTAATQAGEGPLQLDMQLTRGIWIEGRAFDQASKEPIRSGRVGYFALIDNPHAKKAKGFNGASLSTRYRLKADGTYRIAGLPGPGIVAVMAERDHERYQRGVGAETIEGKDERLNGFRTYPTFVSAFNYHMLAAVDPAEDADSIRVDFAFSSGKTLTVRVVDAEGKPVEKCFYTGRMEYNAWRQAPGDRLEIFGYRPEKPRRVQVVDKQRKLAGITVVSGDDSTDLQVTLQPWAEITGRIVNAAGMPQANVEINDHYDETRANSKIAVMPPSEGWQVGKHFTDDEGRFRIAGLVPNKQLALSVSENRKNGLGYFLGDIHLDLKLKPGEVRDLGDVQVQPRERN